MTAAPCRAFGRALVRRAVGAMGAISLGLSLPSAGVAQEAVIVGVVTEALGGNPVAGAVISLVNAEGAVITRIMGGGDGRYTVRVPHPSGEWSIRVTSLGYTEWSSPSIRVSAGTSTRVDVVVTPAPLALEGIEAAAGSDRQCGPLPPDDGSALVRLWERARASLDLAAWSQETGGFRFLLRRYEEEVDPASGAVLAERSWDPAPHARPFESVSAEELNRVGWARHEDPSRTAGPVVYNAPDPAALLSESFQHDYCFGIRTIEDDPDFVAVTFEPEHTGPPIGIIGELWMHRETAELRSLTFRFTGYPGFTDRADGPDLPEATRGRLGGEVGFQTLPTGAVVVSEWALRMPFNTARGVLLRVDRGVLRRTLLPGGGIAPGPWEGVIEGVVHDGESDGRPLAGASVRVAGTEIARITDARGRFRMPIEQVGPVELEVSRPGQAGRYQPNRVSVVVEGGQVARVEVTLVGEPRFGSSMSIRGPVVWGPDRP